MVVSRRRTAPDTARLRQLVDQAGLSDNETAQDLLAVAAATENPAVHDQVHTVLQLAASRRARHPFDEPPLFGLATVPGENPNELELGQIIGSASRFTLDAEQLTRHVLIAGETGAGKTTLIYTLLDELPVPFWAFDLKTDYRHLQQTMPDLVVIPWERLYVNPLQPPTGVTPRRWAQTVQELLGDAYALLSGSQLYLFFHLLSLYEDTDLALDEPVTPDVADRMPTIEEFAAYIDAHGDTGRVKSQYKDRVSDRLRAITAATGDMFASRSGYPLPALLEQDVVFEFDGLAADHQDFIMEWLLTWVYRYRAAKQDRGDDLRHVFVLDEGKRVFSVYKERQDAKGLPKIDELTDKMREFGEALVVGDQEPGKLTDSIIANTQTKILFPIGDATQFKRIARSMQLSTQQQQFAADLDVGQGIVQVGSADPVPVQFHPYPLEKTITDTQLESQLQDRWTRLAPTSPASDAETISRGESAETPALEEDSASKTVQDLDLSEDAAYLLTDIVEHPFKQLTDRYESFDTMKHGLAAKKELVAADLVREKVVKQPYGQFKLLELTKRGRDYIRAQGRTITRKGRGGIVHRYWQREVKQALERIGWTATVEKRNADVFAEKDGQTVAIEIAMRDRDREIDHVKERLVDGIDRVIVLCRSKRVQAGLEEKLAAEQLLETDAVVVRLFQDFTGQDVPST